LVQDSQNASQSMDEKARPIIDFKDRTEEIAIVQYVSS